MDHVQCRVKNVFLVNLCIFRQQYMGWRSQEQLKNTSSTDLISNPAQRLASSSIRPNSANNATSRRKPVKISDYSDFYQEKREKSVPKQDNSALHESIKQVKLYFKENSKVLASFSDHAMKPELLSHLKTFCR